ncbi:capsule assembly Wzi family protein [Halosquirtibacter laminarini]|uniref:Capsule assembly Wzi family protein n=1 Tax=Halosquirtibacter laminarini TaxID=3374600 RepID=A0AC61NBQ8_9BACT|nr:capsule assembly Wzi family protein [Prolixibacteraceae bacterium]
MACHLTAMAQWDFSAASSVMVQGDGEGPFFLYSGKRGTILENDAAVTPYLFLDGSYYHFSQDSTFAVHGLISTAMSYQDSGAKFALDQYFVSADYLFMRLSIGAEAPMTRYGGLSPTNGDMLMSNNARPYPKIMGSTRGYISLPFGWLKEWFSWYAEYGEGLLNDDRIVDGVNLHQKKLHGKVMTPWGLSLEVGLDDYMMWGGTSANPKYGDMTPTFKDYLNGVMGRAASSDGLMTDQMNVVGNHIGQHVFRINYQNSDFEVEGYYLHLFEDGSGKDFKNFPDGTWGLTWHRKKKAWLDRALFEFFTTKDQSGDVFNQEKEIGGRDNYFNHGVYNSGWTYYGRTIGTPFMVPRESGNGFASNRMEGYYLGLQGHLMSNLIWETRFAYWQHWGWNYDNPDVSANDPNYPKSQQSYGIRMIYSMNSNFVFSVDLGLDHGEVVGDSKGALLTVQYNLD